MVQVLRESMQPGRYMIMDSAALSQVFLLIFLENIFAAIDENPKSTLTVDLPNQKVIIDKTGSSEAFEINPYKKENMTNGFDDIDYLLNIKKDIKEFAKDSPL